MPKINVAIIAEVDEGFIKDILDTVAEASSYWADFKVLDYYPSDNSWSSVKSIRIREQEASTDEGVKEFVMDEVAVIRGVKRVLQPKEDGEYLTNDAHRTSILKAIIENDMANMDVWDVDCVVQAAMFNEIVYG